MDKGLRTRLGELLVSYRKQRGLSQKDLAERTAELARRDDTVSSVSVRTIVSLERLTRASGGPRRPRHDTAHSLALALGLRAGSSSYLAFIDAGRHAAAEPGVDEEAATEPPRDFVEAGREQQLLGLSQALDTAAGGTPAGLLVRGEPGAGKSAIISAAIQNAIDRHPRAVVLWARAGADDPPHKPFHRIICLMLGDVDALSAGPPASAAMQQAIAARADVAARALTEDGPLLVATVLSGEARWRHLIDRIADQQVAERLGHLARIAPNDSMRAISGCEQFFRVIGRYTAAGPLFLVFEDLHRADPATLASLGHLLNRMAQRRNLPLAVICSCLPDEQVEPGSAGLREVIEDIQRLYPPGSIDLAGTLTESAASAFAEAMLARAGLPADPSIVSALVARTGGNPLYISRLLDAVAGAQPAGQTALDRIETTVPPSLSSVFAGRIHDLPGKLQHLLTNASVLGADFHAETLMQMLDLSPERFIELVDRQLWRRHRLLRADGAAMTGGRLMHTYRFQPPVLRDALYQGLSDLERTHAHGRAADALLSLHGDTEHDRLGRLAHHLDYAGRRGEAAGAYLRAGEHARRQRDFTTARRYLELAARLAARANDTRARIEALVELGLCERGMGDPGAARTHLTRALDLAGSWHDETLLAKALEARGMLDLDSGDLEDGRSRILRAVDIWSAHDSPETSRALANLSYILYGLGHYDHAIASAERARIEATRSRQSASWIDGTIALANCLIDLGRYDRAAELHEHALLIANELGDLHRQRICWVNLALIAIERGDWGSAEVAIDHLEGAGVPVSGNLKSVVAFHRGLIAEGRDNRAVAREHFRSARELRDAYGHEALVIDAVAGELRIALADRDHDEAETLLDDLEQRVAGRGVDGVEHPGRLYATLIEATLALDRTERAGEHGRAAIAFLTERAARVPEADRESYLWEVPSHRRILDLASKLGAVAG